MSRQLEEYLAAKGAAVLAALDLLAAERRLAEPGSNVTTVLAAEVVLDVAAAGLAAAVDDLPDGSSHLPAGWGEPPAVSGVILVARHRVVKAALRCLTAEYADESADADAEAAYAEEQLALACRNLAADVDARQAQHANESGRLL